MGQGRDLRRMMVFLGEKVSVVPIENGHVDKLFAEDLRLEAGETTMASVGIQDVGRSSHGTCGRLREVEVEAHSAMSL